MTFPLRAAAIILGLNLGFGGGASAFAAATSVLEPVATFAHQVTGVAVSGGGRIFVNFPRWSEDAPVSVGEVLKDGSVKPFPDAEWNSWRSAKPLAAATHFVCVQSVYVAPHDQLWVLDPAAPGLGAVVADGPKLVRIDLATDKVVQTIAFPAAVTPPGSYLNDLRTTPDGAWGFITDSGRGALVVVDLRSGKARRVLDSQAALQADPAVTIKIDGKPLLMPTGKPMHPPSDGIAVDLKGTFVYWQALAGRTLYRLPVQALIDAALPEATLAKQIERVETTHPADGLWVSRKGQLYVTAIETNGVSAGPLGGPLHTVVEDERLRWPDSLAEGPDGSIYVTASHIQDAFKRPASGSIPYSLWRFKQP